MQKHCHRSNCIKYRFGTEKYIKKYIKEKCIKEIKDTQEWQKKMTEFRRSEKMSCLKESGITTEGRRELQEGTLLIDNDKNNVIVDKKYIFLF